MDTKPNDHLNRLSSTSLHLLSHHLAIQRGVHAFEGMRGKQLRTYAALWTLREVEQKVLHGKFMASEPRHILRLLHADAGIMQLCPESQWALDATRDAIRHLDGRSWFVPSTVVERVLPLLVEVFLPLLKGGHSDAALRNMLQEHLHLALALLFLQAADDACKQQVAAHYCMTAAALLEVIRRGSLYSYTSGNQPEVNARNFILIHDGRVRTGSYLPAGEWMKTKPDDMWLN